jgi:hypothetical protein
MSLNKMMPDAVDSERLDLRATELAPQVVGERLGPARVAVAALRVAVALE